MPKLWNSKCRQLWNILYRLQHSNYHINIGRCLAAYILLAALVILPSLINVNIPVLQVGENVYTQAETCLKNWVEKCVVADSSSDENCNQMKLVVSGAKSSLIIRDNPSSKDGQIVGKIENGDEVIWDGRMIYIKEKQRIQPWIYILAGADTEGWSRFSYFRPKEYKDIEFNIIMNVN